MRIVRQHLVLRRLLCLLLCAATWRGPVVWLHSHSDHERNQQADVRLSSHLFRFHHESPVHGSPRWHLHIGLLRDLMADGFDDEGAPSPPASDDPILLAASPGSVLLAPSHCELPATVALVPPVSTLLGFPQSAEVPRGSFLQSYGAAPLRILINVVRC